MSLLTLGVGSVHTPVVSASTNTHSGTFDGTGDYAELASPTGLPSGSSARTVEAWVRTTNTSEQAIMSYGSDAALGGWEFHTANNQLLIRIEGGNQFWTATNINDGNWHHVALTYVAAANISSTTDVLAYMDGTLLTSASSVGATPNTNLTRIRFASDPASIPSLLFNGQVDEIRVWNDVRTQTEIQDNGNTELTGSESGLVGYWKMNNDWNDSTSTGNNLTAAGDATFSTDVPF